MFLLRAIRWLRHAGDDIGRALRAVIGPWVDFAAVKTTQIDIVNALSSQQADIADARVSVSTLGQDLAALNARVAEQDATIRSLVVRLDTVSREQPQ